MRVYMAEFEAAHRYGGMWIAVWHPTVSGRLARCDRMVTMIENMMNKGSVWFATLEEIAQHVASCRKAGTFVPHLEPLPTYAQHLPEETFNAPG
jgi:proteasome lid subunit RPN8/RPN11